MIEYDREIQEIKEIVEKLYKQSKSEGVLVVNEEGQQVIFRCKENYCCSREFIDSLLDKVTEIR